MILLFFPFFIVFSYAIFTKRIVSALSLGILSTMVLQVVLYKVSITNLILQYLEMLYSIVCIDYAMPLLFFILILFLSELTFLSRCTQAYENLIKKHIFSKKQLEKVTLLLAPLFFIDDYLSSMNLGALITPLLKEYGMASVKLAYIINSTSPSLPVLIPFSTWSAMLIGQIKNTLSLLSITDISPVSLLLKCLPFIYYPFCAYLNACYIVWSQKSFGLMKIYENNALNLHERAIASCETKNSLWYEKFLFPTPFIVFFLFVIYDMISYSHIWSTRLEITMVHAIIVSIIVFCSILFFLKKIKVDQISTAFYSVLKENITSVLLLILAWMFAYSTKSLGAATLLTVFLKQHVSFLSLYVVLFFIFSFFLSLFTGSVWGVIALIMPLVTVVGNSSEILFLQFSIAAIISGSMAGSHFSPFSNAVLIAATGARCNIIDHFKTQWVYALGPLCGAFIGLSVSLLLSCYCSYNMIAFISLIFASLTTCFITYCLSRFLN